MAAQRSLLTVCAWCGYTPILHRVQDSIGATVMQWIKSSLALLWACRVSDCCDSAVRPTR